MKRLYLTASACLIIGYCFPQTAAKPRIIDGATAFTKVAKEPKDIFFSPKKTSLNIYPNPANNKVSLQVSGFEHGMATVKIIDMKGNQFREDNRLLISGNEEVVMYFMIPPGVYFVIITQKEKIVRKKLVIN